ncbi:MAG TPA: hypothetical protein VHS96_01785, partial [Bacteroidia bacterium]|nr:hypothetical protein [Bacteroidia bacterium]
MSEEKQKHRLFKVAKELNTRSQLLVDHLVAKGYHISNTPNEKLSEEMYAILLKEFASKRDQKPNNWDENEIGTVTNVEVSSRLAGLRVKGKIDLDALSGKKPKPVTDPEKMLATDSEPKLEEPVTTAPKNQAFQPDLFISYKRDPASMKVV